MTEEVKKLGQIAHEARGEMYVDWRRLPASRRQDFNDMAAAVEAEVLRRHAAEVEALRMDAARYRFLRDKCAIHSHGGTANLGMPLVRLLVEAPFYCAAAWPDTVDDTVDSDMRAAETKE